MIFLMGLNLQKYNRRFLAFFIPALCSSLLVFLHSLAFCQGKKPPEKTESIEPVSASEETIQSPELREEKGSSRDRAEPAQEDKMNAGIKESEGAVTEKDETSTSQPEKTSSEPSQTVQEREKHPSHETTQIPKGSKVHTVWVWQETKDCLWQLAQEHYGDPWQWKKIYLANRNSILDPNVIFPKQKIVIPE